jgi:lipopolysaccharide biosynthesis regulator YciM
MFGDAVGEAMLSSAEESGTDPYMKARGKVAIGDYEAAVAEFREIAKDNPEDRMPVVEIVKLYLDRLHDTNNAELTLENAIRQEHWAPDDAAYFIFRLIDLIQEHHSDDQDRVVNLLQKVMRRYPDTRHSANAIHRLRDIDPTLVASTQAEIAAEQAVESDEGTTSGAGVASPNVPNPNAGPPSPNV